MATVRARHGALACLIVPFATPPALAAERHLFAIPAGPLGAALTAAGAQGDADVGLTDPALGRQSAPALSGRMTTATALARLLRHSGAVAREVRPGSYLVSRTAAPVSKPPVPRAPPVTADAAPATPIIVTASKRGTALPAYAGSVRILPLGGAGDSPAGDVSALVARVPILQSTAFGAGRDKLFVRGIADSSFAGPTQSTVGSYFGETRLIYSGADPSLRLVDMDRVEILEGPQGSLYGAGAIGGIVRLTPNAPDTHALAGSLETSASATQGGRASYDLSGMLNVPVAGDDAAIRAVGYRVQDGGYIDDSQRGKPAINRVRTTGGRLAARFQPDDRWTIDLGGLYQRIRSADPQYAVRGLPGLAHDSAIPQPYTDDFALGSLTATRHSDGVDLLATLGAVDRHSDLRYDATRAGGPVSAYDEHNRVDMVSGELRLWHTARSGTGWLIGIAGVQNDAATRRQLGPPNAQRDITGVANRTRDLALFGEGTLAVTHALVLTAGTRLTHARMDSQPLAARPQSPFIPGKSQTRIDPSLGFTLRIDPRLSWFGRYGRGFRAGGLAVAAGIGRVAIYRPDSIRVAETGLRFDRLLNDTLGGSVAVSQAYWNRIQADLIGANGFPLTANVGDGHVTALEADLHWTPTTRLRVEASGLFAHSALVHPSADLRGASGDSLPDTPDTSGSVSIVWRPPVGPTDRWQITADLHRQGRSRLGAGPLLGYVQSGYTVANLELGYRRDRGRIALRVENLADTRGDRFAIGDPFRLGRESQYTPLRPRTVRLIFLAGF